MTGYGEALQDGAGHWRALLARFAPFAHLYDGSRFAGSDRIVKNYLGIPADLPLPLTFQHGVPTGTDPIPVDIHKAEPLFVATTEQLAQEASPIKAVLRFPHPWLLLPDTGAADAIAQGTLFIGPPSGPQNNQNFLEAISKLSLPSPWTIMVKSRASKPEDHQWWAERGFRVCSAGPPDTADFYVRQHSALAQHECVAVPYMSTIAVFAAAMGKPVIAVTGVNVQWVESPAGLPVQSEAARRTWSKLLSDDRDIARQEALRLLGAPFLAGSDDLRSRLEAAVTAVEQPVYVHGVSNKTVARLMTGLMRRGFPIEKFRPTPFHTIWRKLLYLTGLNTVHVVSGDMFAHYGLANGPGLQVVACRAARVGRKINIGQAPRKAG